MHCKEHVKIWNAFKKRNGKTCPTQKELSDNPYF
jgi:hypothetical protein